MLTAAIEGLAELAKPFLPQKKMRPWEYAAQRKRENSYQAKERESDNTGLFLVLGITLVVIIIAIILIRRKWQK